MSTVQELITDITEFDVAKMDYRQVKVNSRGGKSIGLTDGRGNSLMISTPLILTWGINRNEDTDTGRVSFNMSLQFPDESRNNEELQSFRTNMEAIQERVIEDAVKNSKAWFGKSKMSREVAEELMYPIVKFPKNKETGEPDMTRNPTMTVKIPYYDGKFTSEIYDMNQEEVFTPSMTVDETEFMTFIPKLSHVACILQCGGVWSTGGRFGVTWKLVQCCVRPPLRIGGRCFVKMSKNSRENAKRLDEEEMEKMTTEEGQEEGQEEDTPQVEDTDDENNEGEANESEPEEEAKPKKRTRRRVVKKSA
jgi:hypothetical protein